jgi:hypothetical protein
MPQRAPSQYSLQFNLGLGLVAGLLFWIQFAHPERAVHCWSILGSLLFLAVSYPSRFWAAVTGIFGFEAGIAAGMLLGVENHLLWILGGFGGALLLTLAEHFRLGTIPLPRRESESLRPDVLVREMGMGAFAGSVAATLLRSEVMRLYLVSALIIGLRLLLDRKERMKKGEP